MGMKAFFRVVRFLGWGLCGLFLGVVLTALPATLTLPMGPRPGVAPLTLKAAVESLRKQEPGESQLAAAQELVVVRMQYSRRNGFDSYQQAFERGYGYCIQQAQALAYLLGQLGFTAEVVQATRNRFSDGSVGGHAWVRVSTPEGAQDLDATSLKAGPSGLSFVPLDPVTKLEGAFLGVALWGSPAVNALRYYATGSDTR